MTCIAPGCDEMVVANLYDVDYDCPTIYYRYCLEHAKSLKEFTKSTCNYPDLCLVRPDSGHRFCRMHELAVKAEMFEGLGLGNDIEDTIFDKTDYVDYCDPDNTDSCSKCDYNPTTIFQTDTIAFENDAPRCIHECRPGDRCKRFAKYSIFTRPYWDEFEYDRDGKMVCLQHQEALTIQLINEEVASKGKVDGFKYVRQDLLRNL